MASTSAVSPADYERRGRSGSLVAVQRDAASEHLAHGRRLGASRSVVELGAQLRAR